MTRIEGLNDEIIKQLQYYGAGVRDKVEAAKRKAARNLIKDIQQDTETPERSGDYKKGWTVKRTTRKLIVHNKTNYQLTHLLEKGHKKRGSSDRVEGRPHIRPNEEKMIKEFLKDIEKAIEP